MALKLVNVDEEHERAGHKRRFHWRERKQWIDGPYVKRKVALVVLTEVWDKNKSVTVPARYHEKWFLECGHQILPVRKNMFAATWAERNEKADPNEVEEWCEPCRRKTGYFKVERYREFYWDDGHVCSADTCHSCGACIVCKGHSSKCLEPIRDMLMEQVMEPKSRDDLWDNVSALLSVMTRKQLGECLEVYFQE